MADKTIPELTAAGSLSGTESIHIVQGGESRELTLAELAAYVKLAETIVPTDLPHRGARVHRNTDQTGITFPAIASWQAESFDTDNFWDAGSPTRLTIPAGITKVRLLAQLGVTANTTAGGFYMGIRKNSTGTGAQSPLIPGLPILAAIRTTGGYNTNVFSLSSGVLDVVAGDYFDLRFNTTIAGITSILGDGSSWFELEVVEVD